VFFSFTHSRYSWISLGTACSAASLSSTSVSVLGAPVLVFLMTFQAQPAVQHLGQLLGRIDVEFAAGLGQNSSRSSSIPHGPARRFVL
jgi:purine-cytosine permease-like protein